MAKKLKTVLAWLKFLALCLLLVIEIGLSAFMARIVFDCAKCLLDYPSPMMVLQFLVVLVEASFVGALTFFTIIAITMIPETVI